MGVRSVDWIAHGTFTCVQGVGATGVGELDGCREVLAVTGVDVARFFDHVLEMFRASPPPLEVE